MAGRRAKGNEIWAPWMSIQCIQGIFDSYVFEVIVGSSGALPIFHSLVSEKKKNTDHRAKQSEILASG